MRFRHALGFWKRPEQRLGLGILHGQQGYRFVAIDGGGDTRHPATKASLIVE